MCIKILNFKHLHLQNCNSIWKLFWIWIDHSWTFFCLFSVWNCQVNIRIPWLSRPKLWYPWWDFWLHLDFQSYFDGYFQLQSTFQFSLSSPGYSPALGGHLWGNSSKNFGFQIFGSIQLEHPVIKYSISEFLILEFSKINTWTFFNSSTRFSIQLVKTESSELGLEDFFSCFKIKDWFMFRVSKASWLVDVCDKDRISSSMVDNSWSWIGFSSSEK